jgi:hypothetical protein
MHDAAQPHESSAKAHRPSTPTVFGAAFVAGAVAAFGINSFFDAHVARMRPQVESEPIFVALRSLPQGAPVTVWDVGLRAWPRAMLPETALRAEDRFEGLILRHPLREGQPLLAVQLAQPVAASDAPVEEQVEEVLAVPVPAANAAPARGSSPADTGLATIAPLMRDEVERHQVDVFTPVERVEPAAEATDELATTAPVSPPQPVTMPVTQPDVVETTAPPAPVGAPSETVAAPSRDTSIEAVVQQPIVTADPGMPLLATIGTAAAAPLTTSPEAVDVPPLLPPIGNEGVAAVSAGPPADTLAAAPAAPTDANRDHTPEPSPADTTAADGRGGPAVAVEPLVPEASLVPALVQPLPAVEASVRVVSPRPLVPPTPGSDIETPLATISRQRAAQIAANRPGSVIAAVDPLVQEQAPVPALPPADVAVPLATIAAAQPARRSPTPPPPVAQHSPRMGIDATPRTVTPALVPTTPQATAPTGPATTQAPTSVDVVAAPDAEVDPDLATPAGVTETPPAHPPLRHLVVPERIAMQAEASFVSPKPTPTEEPAADMPPPATTPAARASAGTDPRARSGQTKAPDGNRAAASSTQPRPAPSTRSSSGPVMRAIGSLFQGFSGQTPSEPSRRR